MRNAQQVDARIDGPGWKIPVGGVTFVITRGALILLGSLAVYGMIPSLSGVPALMQENFPNLPRVEDTFMDGLIVALLVALGVLLHETGHAVVGKLVGHPIYGVQIGVAPGVYLEGEPRRWRRLLISAAGPGTELMYAITLHNIAPGEGWWSVVQSPLGFAALISTILAVGGFLPVGGHSDGGKMLRGIKQIVKKTRTPNIA